MEAWRRSLSFNRPGAAAVGMAPEGTSGPGCSAKAPAKRAAPPMARDRPRLLGAEAKSDLLSRATAALGVPGPVEDDCTKASSEAAVAGAAGSPPSAARRRQRAHSPAGRQRPPRPGSHPGEGLLL